MHYLLNKLLGQTYQNPGIHSYQWLSILSIWSFLKRLTPSLELLYGVREGKEGIAYKLNFLPHLKPGGELDLCLSDWNRGGNTCFWFGELAFTVLRAVKVVSLSITGISSPSIMSWSELLSSVSPSYVGEHCSILLSWVKSALITKECIYRMSNSIHVYEENNRSIRAINEQVRSTTHSYKLDSNSVRLIN